MSDPHAPDDATRIARLAGGLYLAIIVLGVWSEAAVRAPLTVAGDPQATAANLGDAAALLRLAFAADTVMALADAALAVLLYHLLRPVQATVALLAMVFRLIQTAILAGNLLNQHAALLILQGGAADAAEIAGRSFALHGFGYDLGLIFFGVNSLLTGWLLIRSGWLPRPVGAGLMAAGFVYLAGSYLRFLAPQLSGAFAPAYAVPLLAESVFCLWLLIRGLGPGAVPGRSQ